MTGFTELNKFDVGAAVLHQEWMITLDTPDGGLPDMLAGLEEHIPMRQGPYDCCSFIRAAGQQRFRALEGSHAGADGTIQQTPASQIVFSIPADNELLKIVFNTIFKYHVNEEPTIRVQLVWGSRSKLIGDKDNPHRYWNRSDAETLHGTSTGKKA